MSYTVLLTSVFVVHMLAILSPGPNQSDNGLGQDDIGIRLIRQKWSPLIGPVTEFD